MLGRRSVSRGISLDMCKDRVGFQATECKVDTTGKEILFKQQHETRT